MQPPANTCLIPKKRGSLRGGEELMLWDLPGKDSSNSCTTSVCPNCAATTAGLSSVGSVGSSTSLSVRRYRTVSRSPYAAEMLRSWPWSEQNRGKMSARRVLLGTAKKIDSKCFTKSMGKIGAVLPRTAAPATCG